MRSKPPQGTKPDPRLVTWMSIRGALLIHQQSLPALLAAAADTSVRLS
jgi:hypothetical protein